MTALVGQQRPQALQRLAIGVDQAVDLERAVVLEATDALIEAAVVVAGSRFGGSAGSLIVVGSFSPGCVQKPRGRENDYQPSMATARTSLQVGQIRPYSRSVREISSRTRPEIVESRHPKLDQRATREPCSRR